MCIKILFVMHIRSLDHLIHFYYFDSINYTVFLPKMSILSTFHNVVTNPGTRGSLGNIIIMKLIF